VREHGPAGGDFNGREERPGLRCEAAHRERDRAQTHRERVGIAPGGAATIDDLLEQLEVPERQRVEQALEVYLGKTTPTRAGLRTSSARLPLTDRVSFAR